MTMGKLSEMIVNVDQSNATEKEIGEQLKELLSMGQTKVQLFRQEIEASLRNGKTPDNRKLPVSKVLGTYEEYRTYTNRTKEELEKNVEDIAAGVLGNVGDEIIHGISSLLTQELSLILGAARGKEMMRTVCYVLVEYPRILRLDVAMWAKTIGEKPLCNRINNVIACVTYKSEVDVGNLDFNEFLGLYATVLNEGFGEQKQDIRKKILEVRKMFDMVH